MRADLERMIMSGQWPPGTRVPVEHQLMATYECSRMTVSKVLGELAARGLINRNRGAGSEVAAPLAERAVLEIRDFAKEAAQTGIPYAHDVLRRETITADAETAKRIGVAQKTKLVAVETLHKLAGRPEAYEKRLINAAAVKEAATETFAESPPGTWLLEHVPWSNAEHAIEAVNANETLATLLEIKVHAACLVVERRTWQLGTLITEARIIYPGVRHRLVGRFSPIRD